MSALTLIAILIALADIGLGDLVRDRIHPLHCQRRV